MMTKEQFIEWFNRGEEYRQTLLEFEKFFSGGEVFESAFGKFYDQYMDLPNFNECAKDIIADFIWWDGPVRWCPYEKAEPQIIGTVEDLYYVVMEISHMENMKEQIDYLIPNVSLSCATLWFPGYANEFVYGFELSPEENDAIVNELNAYIKTNYPEVDMTVHYDNEKFNLWNNEIDD